MSTPKENNKHLKLVEDLVLIFILLFSAQFLNQWWFLKIPLITVLIVGQFTNYRSKFPIAFWGLAFLLVGLDFIDFYFSVANHHFVLLYTVFLIGLSFVYPKQRSEIIKINSSIVIAIIMFFGAVQKFFSPEFMNGNFTALTIARGYYFKPFHWMYKQPDFVLYNEKLLNQNANQILDPAVKQQFLMPFEGVAEFSTYFSIGIVIAELLLIWFLFIKNSVVKNIFLLLFLTGLLLTRLETGFISLISILLIAQLSPENKIFTFLYLILIGVCWSLMVSRLGLY